MNQPDIGKLILRWTLGGLLLLHGIYKILNGIGGIESMLAGHHLPVLLAWGVYIGEVAAPLMVIVGYYARIGAVLIFINMLFAIGLAHMHQIFLLSGTGGWSLELQGFYLLTALALIFLGPGKYKIR